MSLENLPGRQSNRWCALIVMLAVCSLTVSLATRYSTPASSPSSVKIVKKQAAPETARQRLTENAAAWIPPVVVTYPSLTPHFSARIAPAEPAVPNIPLAEALCNRPPPAAALAS